MINPSGAFGCGVLATVLCSTIMLAPAQAPPGDFTLGRAVPNDVFLYVAARHNPERAFLDEYWGEVCQALAASGIGQDAFDLVIGLVGSEKAGEVQRLKERVTQLLAGVDWEQFGSGEIVFAERFGKPVSLESDEPPMMMPSMIGLVRPGGDAAASNYAGLVTILEALVEEVNKALDAEVLHVRKTTEHGAQLATVNLFEMAPEAPALPISVGLREDVLLLALREDLLEDALALLDGTSAKKAIAADPRVQAAFSQLPRPEDSMTFFDTQAMIQPLAAFMKLVLEQGSNPDDVTRNTDMNDQASEHHGQAMAAYRRGDIEKALAATQSAHDADPANSISLYNLACFHAKLGHREEALASLEQAVEGGFYAPRKIAGDEDLTSLRDSPRYEAALARAGKLAAENRVRDNVVNSSRTGEAYRLTMEAWRLLEEQNLAEGLALAEQAQTLAPRDPGVLYALACSHALLEHRDKALTLLEQAVDAGYYCPEHIAKDDDLKSLREQERFQASVATARKKAAEYNRTEAAQWRDLVQVIFDRIQGAVSIMDYGATVETTDGSSTHYDSITALVSDAGSRPIYAFFSPREALTRFDRYLPRETLSFSMSGGADLGALYQFAEDTLRLGGPKGQEVLAHWAEFQKEKGLDLRADVLSWIGGEFIEVSLEDGSSAWLVEVSDEKIAREQVQAGIEFLSTNLPKAIQENPPMAMLMMLVPRMSPADHPELPGFQNLNFAMSPQPVVWGVSDGQLIFSTSAKSVALCLSTSRGTHPSIRDNARAMSEMVLPEGPFVNLSLTDQRNLGAELADIMGAVSMAAGTAGAVAGAAISEPKLSQAAGKIAGMVSKLIPIVRKVDFYKSAASCTTFDGRSWRTRTVTHYVSPEERAAAKK